MTTNAHGDTSISSIPAETLNKTTNSESLKAPELTITVKDIANNNKEKSFGDQESEILRKLIDNAPTASKSIFGRLRSGARSVATGVGQLLNRTTSTIGFGTRKTAEKLLNEDDLKNVKMIAEQPVDATVGTVNGFTEFIKEGAIDFGRDLARANREFPGAIWDTAKDLPRAARLAMGALFIEVPKNILEKIKGDQSLEALAREFDVPLHNAQQELNDYSPAGIQKSAEAEAQVAYDKLYEKTSTSEQMANVARDFVVANVEMVKGMPKAALEMAKFVADDIFIETGKGIWEGLKYLDEKLALSAGNLYREGKESSGANLDQAAGVVEKTRKWLEGVFAYQKENKAQLTNEAISDHDTFQNGLAKLRLANAKNKLSDPEHLSRLIKQGTENAIKEGLSKEEADLRAQLDAKRILEQQGQSIERIKSAFSSIESLIALEKAA